MENLSSLIETRIKSLDLPDQPQNLYEPIRYIMSLGGKRLRPLLVLMGYGLHREDPENIVDQSVAVELFHNFTLMHDDIMDNAPLRRGKPTVHEKWNPNVAILSGDVMLVNAYAMLLSTADKDLPDAIRKFNKCAIEVCEGQQLDMDFEQKNQVSEGEYLEMIRLKTAVLLGFSLELGGILSEMKVGEKRQMRMIGEKAGIGFQLMDDLLDVYGDQSKFGKKVGGDIIANKKTYLLIKAKQLANATQEKELNRWLSLEEFDENEKVATVKTIYDELGIRQLTEEKMNRYYDRAIASLQTFDAREEGKKKLIEFFEKLMKREN